MTSPTDPRDHDDQPPDGLVRSLLWRLRARLVVPPDADRAQADLDRLFAAAREHAHEPARGDIDLRDRTAPHTADSARSDTTDDGLAEVTSLADRPDRGVRFSQQVTRVAAVAVLVVGVGGGLAAAVDRDGTIVAFFGNGQTAEDTDGDITATPENGTDRDPAPAPDDTDRTSPEPSDDRTSGSDAEVAPDRDGDPVDTGDDTTGSDTPADESPDQGPSDRDRGDGERSTDPDDDRSTDPDVGRFTDPDESDGSVDVGDDDIVVALPEDPGDTDGFGGARPCPDGELAGCLSDEGDGGVDQGSGSADDPSDRDDDASGDGEDEDKDKDKDPLEELAGRRFGG